MGHRTWTSILTFPVITDPQGNELFHLREKKLAIHSTWIGEDSSGKEIFVVTKHMSCESPMVPERTSPSHSPPCGITEYLQCTARSWTWTTLTPS